MTKSCVITIARGYGSGGKTIGKMLSEQLQIPYYDRDLLRMASDESGIHERLFAEADERVRKPKWFQWLKSRPAYKGTVIPPGSEDFVSDHNLFNYQAKIIREVASQGSCVIVGRCADFVLRDRDDLVRVFVHASREACIANVMRMFSVSREEAIRRIEKIDRERSAYYRYYTGRDWDNARNYDLCLDSSNLGFQKCVDIIKGYIEIRNR